METRSTLELMIRDFLAWLTDISDSNFLESKGASIQLLNTFMNYYHGDFSRFALFIEKTKELMNVLNQQGFPLAVNGKQVVHFCEPKECLGEGEMYFQVGRTTPGTLSLKFAKKNSEEASPQVSTVETHDFCRAYTSSYFEELRAVARQAGSPIADSLFHECIVTDVKHSIVTYLDVDQLAQCGQICSAVEDTSPPDKTDIEDLHYNYDVHCIQESCNGRYEDSDARDEFCFKCTERGDEKDHSDVYLIRRGTLPSHYVSTVSNQPEIIRNDTTAMDSRELITTTSVVSQIRNGCDSSFTDNQPYPSTRDAVRRLSGKLYPIR